MPALDGRADDYDRKQHQVGPSDPMEKWPADIFDPDQK